MISNQAYLFFIFVLNGVTIGLLFDFFRILRRSFKTSNFVTYIEDILFWILTGGILLYAIFVFNNGEIRLYLLLGILFGTIVYMLTLSSYIIKFNVKIIKILKSIIYEIFKVLIIPLRIVFEILKKFFFKPVSFFTINIRKISTRITSIFINKIKSNKNIVKN